ncbi:glucose-fructose oxidoreductase [Maribacter caenipelagi]|uniref:Glucose-fructose oxidoreductase n=1 Tax=Maribacter caenipelagi TaxID=1447781 RepID=A0A4R7DMU4_9FLAO|nr:Gfo/Idh/MocA family oxidoreductase [Maribacter caenipelagi]TDS20826.1 glucose-fructose oxidoreductase [Maribacter caenipelagi]
MKKLSRRSFSTIATKGILGTTLLGNMPLANAFSIEQKNKKLGVALVGLGSYSTYQLAPSLLETEYCYLAGIVTGTKDKEALWQEKYNIPKKNVYNYDNFDTILNNEDIDVVYVVLPNSMHADFCIRAAKAGKHVICEKPMAVSVEECDDIINACKENNVKLSVGYRMQSDLYTHEVKKYVKEKTFGDVLFVSSDAGYISKGNPDQWRLDKSLSGGGALMNMGVYAIQTSIYGTGQNPISVSAQEFSTRPEYFKDTDETITAQFKFDNGAVAHMMTSHNANGNRLKCHCSKGWFELDPAHSYGPISGRTSNGNTLEFPFKKQQALQMDDFSKHILLGTKNVAPGEMGKRDMIIVEAIYKSIYEGGKEQLLSLGDIGIVY